ncbi:site-specific recombinase XerD [Algoriphagus boseongensis]|uniref:Site-specific recombinase XerD n=1 Tax=Algoriphagus boseongensis TaxID=1442587 RepID=A0A4V3D2E2_9BACT|nr:tyrosine-type recombinase/integrase [Algoriphagus boseongensis]TDQ18617.1 site-specific recombinase XerD [Algoriphagus boseongensis]
MKTKIYLDSKLDKEGKGQLFFYIIGSGKRSKLYSGIKVNPDNWKNGLISSREPYHDLSNALLQAKFSALNKLITELKIQAKVLEPEEIKELFLQRLEKKQHESEPGKTRLIDYLDYCRTKYTGVKKESTLRAIKQVQGRIQEYDQTICLETIDHQWLVGYCKFLIQSGIQDSTIKSRHLKEIKFACREALRNGIPVSVQVENFTWKINEKQPFYATWEEVEAISAIQDFVRPIQQKIRDLFILSCYTGLRISDWNQINKDNLFEQAGQKMLRVQVQKTGFDYAIPLQPQVLEILVRYNYQIPTYSQQEFNREIKKVAQTVVNGQASKVKFFARKRVSEKIPKHKFFSSHTGRRTFGRRYLDKGGSLVILCKIFGQKSTETTMKYLGYQPQEVVTEFQKVFGN